MPNWKDLLDEIKASGSIHDVVRRKYLNKLSELTGRNVIVYYSAWLQNQELVRQGFRGFLLDDNDKNGFMTTIHRLDRSKGLDLLLHTPGGGTAATESLVDYLRSMFGTNMRAVIPQIALSAGTMMALACKEIIMGEQSSLGPIDPQVRGVPAHGVIEEFNRAADEIKKDNSRVPVWQPIIANYSPTLIGECEKAIAWSEEMVREWLISGMFAEDENKDSKADKVKEELGVPALTKSHDRHISIERAREIGLKVMAMEDGSELQDAILSVHHACIHTFSSTDAIKIIENQNGVAFIQQLRIKTVPG